MKWSILKQINQKKLKFAPKAVKNDLKTFNTLTSTI